jgi:hypothetical protein
MNDSSLETFTIKELLFTFFSKKAILAIIKSAFKNPGTAFDGCQFGKIVS